MTQKKCKNCGAEVDETAKFCPECGKPIIKRGRPRKVALVKCVECGYEYTVDNNICPNCGYPSKIEESAEDTKICPECQNKVAQTAKECPECGYPFEEETHVTETLFFAEEPHNKNNRKIDSSIIFYIIFILIFIAGCITAVLIYSKIFKSQKVVEPESISYKITRTLSCINDSKNEERNYYFDKETLIKYSMYASKDFTTETNANNEVKKFNNKWDNTKLNADIYAHKNDTVVTESLIIDLKNTNTSLDDDINSNESYIDIKKKLEDKNWYCSDYNKDLGTNLPINDIKAS